MMPTQAVTRCTSDTGITLAGLQFTPDLIGRLNRQGPRYTSYPTADRFSTQFGASDYLQAVNSVRALGARHPLSRYVHIPFCETVCYYCGGNKIVTSNRAKASTYLTYLKREIDMQGRLFAGMNHVAQLHLGGGTPTFLDDAQLAELMTHFHRWFRFADDQIGEYSIEIDPRTVSHARMQVLRDLGFNLAPCAPSRHRARAIAGIIQRSLKRLSEAGYVYIGMDHFAKPDDDLAIAQRQGRLHRNFQGYSTPADAPVQRLRYSATI